MPQMPRSNVANVAVDLHEPERSLRRVGRGTFDVGKQDSSDLTRPCDDPIPPLPSLPFRLGLLSLPRDEDTVAQAEEGVYEHEHGDQDPDQPYDCDGEEGEERPKKEEQGRWKERGFPDRDRTRQSSRRRFSSFAAPSVAIDAHRRQAIATAKAQKRRSPVQYCDGYYLCTPPPLRHISDANRPAIAAIASQADLNTSHLPLSSLTSANATSFSAASTSPPSPASSSQPSVPLQQQQPPAKSKKVPLGLMQSFNPIRENGSSVGTHRSGPEVGRMRSSSDASAPIPQSDRQQQQHKPDPTTKIENHTFGEEGSQEEVPRAREVSEEEPWRLQDYFVYRRQREAHYGGRTREVRFHGYDARLAPYWLSHSFEAQMAEQAHYQMMSDIVGLGATVWPTVPPESILDVATGSGAWVLEAAKQWPDSEFVGLDLVPVQTPLKAVHNKDIASRVTWVVANVLEGLPFPSNSFDFVHCRFLNNGVPEDKWDFVFGEFTRVVKAGGRIEILETDWSFSGTPREVATADVQKLISGQHETRRRGVNNSSENMMLRLAKASLGPHDKIGKACERIMQKRFISLTPVSLVPFNLMNQELEDVKQGNPRSFPIFADSAHRRNQAEIASQEGKATSAGFVNDSELSLQSTSSKGQSGLDNAQFTSREQIGTPLEPHQINMSNYEFYRASILTSESIKISECRTLIWEELEHEMNSSPDPLQSIAAQFGWKHQWQFFKAIDEWMADMTKRADWSRLLDTSGLAEGDSEKDRSETSGSKEVNAMTTSLPSSTFSSPTSSPTRLMSRGAIDPANSSDTLYLGRERRRSGPIARNDDFSGRSTDSLATVVDSHHFPLPSKHVETSDNSLPRFLLRHTVKQSQSLTAMMDDVGRPSIAVLKPALPKQSRNAPATKPLPSPALHQEILQDNNSVSTHLLAIRRSAAFTAKKPLLRNDAR